MFLLKTVLALVSMVLATSYQVFMQQSPFFSKLYGSSNEEPTSPRAIMKRYDVVPVNLYRLNPKNGNVSLRSYEQRLASGLTGDFSYDLHEHDGLVLPTEGQDFTGPNGMSCRPLGETHRKLVVDSNSLSKARVFVLEAGLPLPENLVLVHEFDDHYSVQVKKAMPLANFNHELSTLLKSCKALTAQEYLELYEEDDDEDDVWDVNN